MLARSLKILKRLVYITIGFFVLLTLLLLIFRKKIERYAISQLDPYFKVPVYIHDVDFTFWKTFPNFSLRLEGVLIKDYDKVLGQSPDTLLYAETIDLKANTWSLMKADLSIQSVEIEKARIGLRVDKNGKENFDIFVKDTTSKEESSFNINLKRVHFSEVDFSFKHFENQQEYRAYFDKLRLSGSFKTDKSEMELFAIFDIIKFKDKSLTLLKKAEVHLETAVIVDNKAKRYEIPNTVAEINEIPFNLKFLQDSTKLKLDLHAKKVPLDMLMEAIHQADINKFKNMNIEGEADMHLQVSGSPNVNSTPNISAAFSIKNGKLKDKQSQLNIQKLNLEGNYEKIIGRPEILQLKKFQVTTMGQTLEGQLSVQDFGTPKISAEAQGDLNLKALHHFFPIPKIASISGNLWIKGFLRATILNPGQRNQEIYLANSKSDLDCRKIQLKLKSDVPEFKEINGKVSTRNDDFIFNQFQLRTAGSQLEISGNLNNVLNYLEREEALDFNAAIIAERINVNEFIHDSGSSSSPSSESFGVYLLPKSINGQVEYEVKNVVVGTHNFSKLIGNIQLHNRELDFRNIQLEHIGSFIKGDFKMFERSPGTFDLLGDVVSKNIDLKKLFAEWNNFEQENIKSQNITGNAEVHLQFSMPYDIQSGPVKESLSAQVSLSVDGGALIQMESLKEIAKSMKSNDLVRILLGKNLKIIERKLEKLTFDKLENTFYISNSKFVIPKMIIKTNVMELTVSGWQHFNESLEYRFEFDFKDLKQQKRDSPSGEGKFEALNTRLFLKMYGTLSKLQFAWDSDAKKAHKQEQRAQQKIEFKGMLKSDFGLFKKDSTVQAYQKTQAPKETITLDFGEETPQPNPVKKKREINQKFNKIRKENQTKNEQIVIEVE